MPERFHENWPRDAFLPFSAGPRACLGRRYVISRASYRLISTTRSFFETEGIAIMTLLLSRYKVELKDEPEFANETFEEKYQRVLQVKQGITLA